MPLIVGRPDVSERAEALMDACHHRAIKYTPTYAREDGPELIERRVIRKSDLVEWLKEHFTGADAKLGGGGVAPEPSKKNAPEESAKLLLLKEVLERVGVSKATLYRLMNEKKFPPPDFLSPNQWRLSTVSDYIERKQQPPDADI